MPHALIPALLIGVCRPAETPLGIGPTEVEVAVEGGGFTVVRCELLALMLFDAGVVSTGVVSTGVVSTGVV